MNVVAHDNVTINYQAFHFYAEIQAVNNNVAVGSAGENVNPFVYCASNKVHGTTVSNFISITHIEKFCGKIVYALSVCNQGRCLPAKAGGWKPPSILKFKVTLRLTP